MIKTDNELILRLNTGEKIKLDPKKLFVRNDNLYIQNDDDLIKFNEYALFSLAEYMDDEDDQYAIYLDGKRYLITTVE